MEEPNAAEFTLHPYASHTPPDLGSFPAPHAEHDGLIYNSPVISPTHQSIATLSAQKRAYRQRRKDPSCDPCRQRKIKCDATDTTNCSECSSRGVKCQFTTETNRRMSSIKQVQDLERQLMLAKDEISRLKSTTGEAMAINVDEGSQNETSRTTSGFIHENRQGRETGGQQSSMSTGSSVQESQASQFAIAGKVLGFLIIIYLLFTVFATIFDTPFFVVPTANWTTDHRYGSFVVAASICSLVTIYLMVTGRGILLWRARFSPNESADLQFDENALSNQVDGAEWAEFDQPVGDWVFNPKFGFTKREDVWPTERISPSERALEHSPSMASIGQTQARVSCVRCRSRKVKCDGKNPCSGCTKAGVNCIVNDTAKKLVVTKSYLDGLITSLDRLERENNGLRKNRSRLDQRHQGIATAEQRLEPAIPSNSTTREQVSPYSFNFMRSVQGLVPISALRLLRPNVRPGCQRLEWRCSCGRAMYGDYSRHNAMHSSSLVRNLPDCQIIHTAGDNDASQDHGKTPKENPSSSHVPSNTSDRLSNASTLESTGSPTPTKSDLQSISLDSTSMKQLSESVPAFFELCINGSKTRVRLGEIIINDGLGNRCIKTDMQLFKKIRKQYDSLKRKGLYRLLYRPSDIQFVRFGVQRGGYQTGIYQKPLAIPPAAEVKEQRYHYYECPLDPLPPIDRGTFFHYFWDHASHPETSGHSGFDTLFFNRLPKKLGSSILLQCDPGKLQLGWGVHIIEGPNKPLLAWLATGILVLSFMISLVYDIVFKNKESGFAIGQWIVAVLSTALTAVYFHLADIA